MTTAIIQGSMSAIAQQSGKSIAETFLTMYITHFLFPEQQWGVFKNDEYICAFDAFEDAAKYCNEHNAEVV